MRHCKKSMPLFVAFGLCVAVAASGCGGNISLFGKPTADAGGKKRGFVGQEFRLDGTGSRAAGGGTLSFAWEFVTFPTETAGASPALKAGDSATPSFVPAVPGVYLVKLVVAEGEEKSVPDFAAVEVVREDGNSPPVVDAGAGQTVRPGARVTLQGSAEDPDGDDFSVEWVQVQGKNTVTLTGADGLSAEFDAPAEDDTLEFVLRADDHQPDGVGEDKVIVTVSEENQPPLADAGIDQEVIERARVVLSGGTSSDPEGSPLDYKWTQTGGPAVTLQGSTSAHPAFVAPEVPEGAEDLVLKFSLTVSDKVEFSEPDECTVTVRRFTTNHPPTADSGPDQIVGTHAVVYLSGALSFDIDGDALTYEWVQTSGGAVKLTDASIAVPMFVAPASEGVLKFELLVHDGKAFGEPDETVITVKDNTGNAAPTADAGVDLEVPPGARVALSGAGSSDPDLGDTLAYQWAQTEGTPVVLSGADTVTPVFTAPGSDGDLTFSLTVNDGKVIGKPDSVVVRVRSGTNHVPEAFAGPDQVVDVGALVELDGSASTDADGDGLTFQWIQLSGSAAALDDPGAPKPKFSAPLTADELVFRLIVRDGKAWSIPDDIKVTVRDFTHNKCPEANAGSSQTVPPNTPVYLNGTRSSDPDKGDVLTYQWSQTDGPAVALAGDTGPVASFLAPASGTLQFALVVNDGLCPSDPAGETTVYVMASAGAPPVADAGPSQRANFGTPVTLDGTKSYDPSGKPLTYSWYQISGDPVALDDPGAASPGFTSPQGPNPQVLKFGLVVGNGAAYSAPAETSVSVEDPRTNNPPAADAGAEQSVVHGRQATLAGAASDPDSDPVAVRWEQISGPSVTLSSATVLNPTFSSPDEVADLEFELTVSDGFALAKDRTVVHVTNIRPVADAGSDVSVTATAKFTPLTLSGSATDGDGDLLTYEWKNGQTTMASSAVADVTLPKGSFALDFVASDGVETGSDQLLVKILNATPIADAGPDQFVAYLGAPTEITLDGSGSHDVDEDALTFTWKEGAATLGAGQVLKVSLDKGSHTITLEVSDGSAVATDTVAIDIDIGPPAGAIVLHANPASITANGVALSTITSEPLLDVAGTQVKDGNLVTVASGMAGTEIVATDADGDGANGIQVASSAGIITFAFRGTKTGGATVTAAAVSPGTATGQTQVTLVPGPAAGTIVLRAVPGALPADATSTSTITSEPIIDAFGNNVGDGSFFTVASDNGTITTADADGGAPGIQVVSSGGQIQFTLRAPAVSCKATVTADAVSGSAHGEVTVDFTSGPAAGTIVLHASPASIPADGASTTVVVSEPIKDTGGNTVPDGVLITVSVNVGLITTPDADSNTAGVQVMTSGGTITFTVQSGTVSGDCLVNASAVAPGTATGSLTVPFTAGPVARIVFSTQPPSAAQAGQLFAAFRVRMEDQYGNVLSNDSSSMIDVVSTGTDSLQGTVTKTVVAGVATFDNIFYRKAEIIKVRASVSGQPITADSNNVVVSAGAPNKLNFCQGPATPARAGVVFPEFRVCITDTYGNVPLGLVQTAITVSLVEVQPPWLIGTLTRNTTDGVASFNDVQHNAARTIHLTADTTYASQPLHGESGPVVVNAGDLAKIVYNPAPPAAAGAGQAFTAFKAELRDTFDNVLNTDNTSVVVLTKLAGTGTLSGTLSRTVVAGVATFNDVSSCTIEGGLRVRASTQAPNPVFNADSANINVSAGPMASLTVAGLANAPNECTVQSMTVEAKDSCGNRATGYRGTVGFSTDSAGSTLPGNYAFTAGDSGFHTFAGGVTLKGVGGPFYVRATDGGVSGQQSGLTVAFGAHDHFAVSGIGTPQTDCTVSNVTVEALNVCNSRVTSYLGTITFSSDDAQAVFNPATYAFNAGDSGIRTFTGGVQLKSPGTRYVRATDGTITGQQSSIVVNVGTAASFVVTGIGSPQTDCTVSSVTVEARDACNQRATGYRGTVTFSSDDGVATLPGNYTFTAGDNGIHAFTNGVTLRTPGTRYVKATDTVTGSITGQQSGITVNLGPTTHLHVEGITSPHTAGTLTSPVVTAHNACENVDTNYAGTVHFTSSDDLGSTVLPADSTLTNGTKTFTGLLKLTKAGTEWVRAEQVGSPGINGQQSNIAINPASASTLVVSGISDPFNGCTSSNVTVTARDQYGNTATGYTGTITFTSTDGAASLPANYTFVPGDNGTKTFADGVIMRTNGERSVTATDTVTGTITGSQTGITVQSGGATYLVVDQITDPITAGSASNVRVTAYDACNNVATNYTGTVAFTTSDSSSNPDKKLPANYTFVPGDLGTKTFAAGVVLVTAAEQWVKATDTITSSITGQQNNITVQALASDKYLSWVTQPSTPQTAGTEWPQAFSVERQDRYGNDINGDNTSVVTIESAPGASGLLSGTKSATMVNSIAVFTQAVNHIAYCPAETIKVRASSIGFANTPDSNNIVVNYGAAAQLTFGTQPPASVTAGATWANFTVQVRDSCGNLRTGDGSTQVPIEAADTAVNCVVTAPDLNGTLTRTASGGVATFNNITYNVAKQLKVHTKHATLTNVCSTAVTVNPAALDHFKVEYFSGGDIPQQTVSVAFLIDITAQDQYNNTVVSFVSTVDLTSSNGSISGGEPKTTSNFVAGKLDNYSVTLTAQGSGVTLTATGSGKNGTSNAFNVCGVQTSVVTYPANAMAGDIVQLDGSASQGANCAAIGSYKWDIRGGNQLDITFIDPANPATTGGPPWCTNTVSKPVFIACATNPGQCNAATKNIRLLLTTYASAGCAGGSVNSPNIDITEHNFELIEGSSYNDLQVAAAGTRVGEVYLARNGSNQGYRIDPGASSVTSFGLNSMENAISRVAMTSDNMVWFSEEVAGSDCGAEIAHYDPFAQTSTWRIDLCPVLRQSLDADDVKGTYSMAARSAGDYVFVGTDDGYTRFDSTGDLNGVGCLDGASFVRGDRIYAYAVDKLNRKVFYSSFSDAGNVDRLVLGNNDVNSCGELARYDVHGGVQDNIWALAQGPGEEFWIGSYTDGNEVKRINNISSIPGVAPTYTDFPKDAGVGVRTGPNADDTRDILWDTTGDAMWLGQFEAVSKYTRQYQAITPFWFNMTKGNFVLSGSLGVVRGVGVYNNGSQKTIWLATDTGVYRMKNF
ncbi:MAG: hypothetical protein HY897_04120 [Deltaproteobacteria bacterium]|nr:hypothetical protein [Deltaproteobacteria bacterium]